MVVISIALFLIAQALCTEAQCPADSKPYKNACYYFSHDKEEWTGALYICKDFLGGSLTDVQNQEENNFLAQNVNKTDDPFWIGANDLAHEGSFRWVVPVNTSVTYGNWVPGQPSNYKNREHCVIITHSGVWNDVPCRLVNRYICKIPQKS